MSENPESSRSTKLYKHCNFLLPSNTIGPVKSSLSPISNSDEFSIQFDIFPKQYYPRPCCRAFELGLYNLCLYSHAEYRLRFTKTIRNDISTVFRIFGCNATICLLDYFWSLLETEKKNLDQVNEFDNMKTPWYSVIIDRYCTVETLIRGAKVLLNQVESKDTKLYMDLVDSLNMHARAEPFMNYLLVESKIEARALFLTLKWYFKSYVDSMRQLEATCVVLILDNLDTERIYLKDNILGGEAKTIYIVVTHYNSKNLRLNYCCLVILCSRIEKYAQLQNLVQRLKSENNKQIHAVVFVSKSKSTLNVSLINSSSVCTPSSFSQNMEFRGVYSEAINKKSILSKKKQSHIMSAERKLTDSFFKASHNTYMYHRFKFRKETNFCNGFYTTRINMPITAAFHQVSASSEISKKDAEEKAALEAVNRLNLAESTNSKIVALDANLKCRSSSFYCQQFHSYPSIPPLLSVPWVLQENLKYTSNIIVIRFEDQWKESRTQGFLIFCPANYCVDKFPKFLVPRRDCAKHSQILLEPIDSTVELTREELDLLKNWHVWFLRLFSHVRELEQDWSQSTRHYLIAPSSDINKPVPSVDWSLVKFELRPIDIDSPDSTKYSSYATVLPRRFQFVDRIYIFQKFDTEYYDKGLCLEDIPPYSSIIKNKKINLKYKCQPLIEAKVAPSRACKIQEDFKLKDAPSKVKRPSKFSKLITELYSIYPAKELLFYDGASIFVILYHMESIMRAHHISRNVIRIGSLIGNDQHIKNLAYYNLRTREIQNLELFGDSILKLVVYTYISSLIARHTIAGFTKLSKGWISNLAAFCAARPVHNWIEWTCRHLQKLCIPGFSSPSFDVVVSPKIISDFTEVFLGSCYQNGDGLSCVKEALCVLGYLKITSLHFPSETPREEEQNFTRKIGVKWLDDASVKEIENILGYRWKNLGLLYEALVHETCPASSGIDTCSTKLSFIGDAVLDFVILRHFIWSDRDKLNLNQGHMTDLKIILTNGATLAYMAYRLQLQKYILFNSEIIEIHMKKYVEVCEERLHWSRPPDIEFMKFMSIDYPIVLNDLFEAIVGSIYVDSGYSLSPISQLLFKWMHPLQAKWCKTDNIIPSRHLHELIQKNTKQTELKTKLNIAYERIKLKILKTTMLRCKIDGHTTYSIGSTYKQAKTQASCKMLMLLDKRGRGV